VCKKRATQYGVQVADSASTALSVLQLLFAAPEDAPHSPADLVSHDACHRLLHLVLQLLVAPATARSDLAKRLEPEFGSTLEDVICGPSDAPTTRSYEDTDTASSVLDGCTAESLAAPLAPAAQAERANHEPLPPSLVCPQLAREHGLRLRKAFAADAEAARNSVNKTFREREKNALELVRFLRPASPAWCLLQYR
jgi:hypothetical protein